MSRHARAGLLASYAVVTFLSFPHPLGTRVIDAGVWLAWIGPAVAAAALGKPAHPPQSGPVTRAAADWEP